MHKRITGMITPWVGRIVEIISKNHKIAQMAEYRRLRAELLRSQPESLAACGYKVYSQTDEDGIIAAIFSRIGRGGTFMEVGVQDGRECNTHLLLLNGWRGVWVEADRAACAAIRDILGKGDRPGRFRLVEEFIRPSNVVSVYRSVCEFVGIDQLDFFSIDIDGNDIQVLSALLEGGGRPRVICAEYNAKFPPPIRISVPDVGSQLWQHDDYFGASLQLFYDLLKEADYRLVACNLPGTNAFFVREDCAAETPDLSPDRAYQPLLGYLSPLPPVHTPTLKYLRDALDRP